MKNLTILAAALAAGLTTFAAHAEDITLAGEKIATMQSDMKAARTKALKTEQKAGKDNRAETAATRKASADKKVAARQLAAKKAAREKVAAWQLAAKEAAEDKKASAMQVAGKSVARNKKMASKNAGKGKLAVRGTKTPARIDTTETASISQKLTRPDKDDIVNLAAGLSGGNYGSIVARYAASYGVPVSLAHAVITVESNYRPNTRGRAGEIGLMQIKPATARMLGYSGSTKGLYDPETNIKWGMKYLGMAQDLGGGTTCGTILKYNAGHAAKRMNPVSSAYCSKVKRHLAGL